MVVTRPAPSVSAIPEVSVVLPAAESPTMPTMTWGLTRLKGICSAPRRLGRRGVRVVGGQHLPFAGLADDHQGLEAVEIPAAAHALDEEPARDSGGAEDRVPARHQLLHAVPVRGVEPGAPHL